MSVSPALRSELTTLSEAQWRAAMAEHEARVDELTAGHRARRQRHEAHPVEDFLFTYYSWQPSQLRRWHPGAGVTLASGSVAPQLDWRFYALDAEADTLTLDVEAFLSVRGEVVAFVRDLLTQTKARAGRFGCFGMHEWAMVYRQEQSAVRHSRWPLRLGSAGTDEVVESHQIACTHFDAYRFFTPAARPLNQLSPTREGQVANEQPGCLHAGMDLYKWAMKLSPAVPSTLTLACFELAREIRELDMRASPYDLSELGYAPIAIETPQGKAEYAAAQRAFSARSQHLRAELLTALDRTAAQIGRSGLVP